MKLVEFFSFFVLFGLCYGQFKRVCYYAGWARYRNEDRQNPEDLDVSLCTHILYAFAKVDDSATHIKAFDDGDDPDMYRRFVHLKTRDPHLKTLLSVGGASLGSHLFHLLVSNPATTHEFARNAITYLRGHNFDGMDVDWEYPAAGGSPPADKQKFTEFLQVVHSAFAAEATSSGKPRLLLTAALAPSPWRVGQSYELPKVANYLDFINLMTYDLHGEWDQPLVTGHNSPLYAPPDHDSLNVDSLVSYWAKQGVPKDKIIIGVPLFGHTYIVNDPKTAGVGVHASAPGDAGSISQERGVLAYLEICQIIKSGHGTVKELPGAKVPIMADGHRWTGYDDVNSVKAKCQYVKDHGYGGVFVWSLDYDDFNGHCGHKWPLLTAIKEVLGGGSGIVG